MSPKSNDALRTGVSSVGAAPPDGTSQSPSPWQPARMVVAFHHRTGWQVVFAVAPGIGRFRSTPPALLTSCRPPGAVTASAVPSGE